MSSNVAPEPKEAGIYADYSGIEELWLNDRCLPRYNRDITAKLTKYFKPPQRVLDFGAGIGTLASLCRALSGVKPDGLEISPKLRDITISRGFTCFQSLHELTAAYDGIYTANVLEHVEEDAHLLTALREKLVPNGVLAVYVPAFMCLYSEIDKKVGHFRRYSRHELVTKIRDAGFDILECSFVDSVGFFAWFAVKFTGYKKGEALGSEASLRFYDRFLYPISQWVDALGAKHLFGKNLLVIARKNSA